MLTKNEITALSLSPTKKDFVQIWNELLEVAGRLSERWDPTSTNESDPGIVILKALTGIADKLNYNIDKNTLEAFMPTAAQEDSMRKLCDMLGYNIKYYRSAETMVTIKYHNSDPSEDEKSVMSEHGNLAIPKFTVITNSDQDINYFTTNQIPVYISKYAPSISIKCMEGQIVKCESTADNNVITASQISENNRFYLPEAQIAENGIFVYNVAVVNNLGQADGDLWTKVDNLNTQARGSRVFKFGYDSYEGRPYLEFPEDYSELINDGLFIYYTRTSGANGNISARTLTQIELPNGTNWDKVSAESFSAENAFSATSGANLETINQAYNNFKKTVGTFETLVTCRDYMNKIYTMTDDSTGKYLVSNALVTDIRTDLNRAITICSCDDAGIFYKDVPLTSDRVISEVKTTESSEATEISATKPVYSTHSITKIINSLPVSTNWYLGDDKGFALFNSADIVAENSIRFKLNMDGQTIAGDDGFWHIEQDGVDYKTKWPVVESIKTVVTSNIVKNVEESVPAIDHFDLVLYPFKSYNQIRGNVKDIQEVYDASFKYDQKSFNTVEGLLKNSDIKTIAHKIIAPRIGDIVSINNYLRLNAIIGTHTKLTAEEGTLLIETIKIALANAFNMRELDFGEEIPFDSIVSVIENADSRIKVVSLAEPALYTTFSVFGGYENGTPVVRECAVASDWLTDEDAEKSGRFDYGTLHTFNKQDAKKIYNKLAVRNVLAGRVPLFKYNTNYEASFSDGAYRITEKVRAEDLPDELKADGISFTPTQDNPFTIYTIGDVVYTGQLVSAPEKPEGAKQLVYTKTFIPNEGNYNNIITKDPDDDSNITQIQTSCEISADKDDGGSVIFDGQGKSTVTDVTLAAGEFIKFRAPSLLTDKTYPAYVNYHLDLGNNVLTEAEPATAYSLYSLLNDKDNVTRGLPIDERRQEVLNYFDSVGLKSTFTLTQKVAKKTEGSFDEEEFIKNPSEVTYEKAPTDVLRTSGFVKLISKTAELKWEPVKEGDIAPAGNVSVAIADLPLEGSSFIVSTSVFDDIKTYVDSQLTAKQEELPTECDWSISYKFEYVPFDAITLNTWIKCVVDIGDRLFGFSPSEERGTVLWRSYGNGYSVGKYILLPDLSKLMPFTSNHFESIRALAHDQAGIYIVEDLGHDVKANFIGNTDEYMLREGEYLFIEYTPSTTAEGTSTKDPEPIKETYSKGTIIKPSGFANGLMDSSEQSAAGNSAHKEVTFEISAGTTRDIPMYSLGANEQIEIRDFAQVKLSSDTLESSYIYVYKNFNDCPALEVIPTDGTGYSNGVRINNTYTLKDGEYIFYTDQNQTEFAYFSAGTEVTLTGNTVLPRFDIIDLATIFDSGIQEIPWKTISLTNKNGIIFQEFQYITLGDGDTLNRLKLGTSSGLNGTWQACEEVAYTPAGEDTLSVLPAINISDEFNNGRGWEACSLLELSSSPSIAQTLRKTDKITTSIKLIKEASSGVNTDDATITLEAIDSEHPISFKTNLMCHSSGDSLKISDLYANPNNLKSFELKVFAEESPKILQTKPDSLIPYRATISDSPIDIAKWSPDSIAESLSLDNLGAFWQLIELKKLVSDKPEDYDKALKLSVSTLPNTYGIFSIYLDYLGLATEEAAAWIEILPGASTNDITIFNLEEKDIEWVDSRKLMLKPGINCIRVNKTSDIFIKTNANDGALYFDNIRLVDCRPIENPQSGKVEATQGLNLAQIGYLDTSDENSSSFNGLDARVRNRIRTELTKETHADLDALAQNAQSVQASEWKELQESKTKLQDLVEFLANTKKELENLTKVDIDTDGDGYIDTDLVYKTKENLEELFSKYNKLREDLEQEEALKAALDNNRETDGLEQALVSLLKRYKTADALKQELFNELDKLDIAARTNANIFASASLSRGDILDDFAMTAPNADDPARTAIVNDLKLASIKEINNLYSLQLDTLASILERIDDDDIRTSVIAILDNINNAKHAALIAQISALVETNQENLESTLAEAQETAAGAESIVQYSDLANVLIRLREQLSSANVKELINQINIAANSNMISSDKYDQLNSLVGRLKQLLTSETAITGSYASLIDSVNSILIAVQAKIAASNYSYDSSIVSAIAGLSSEVAEVYVEQLRVILTEIENTLVALDTDASNIIDQVNSSDNEVAESILASLSVYAETRSAQLEQVDNFGSNFTIENIYFDLPYGVQAVLNIWPAYMKRSFIIGIDKLYKDIREMINNPIIADGYELLLDKSFYSDIAKTKERRLLVTTANVGAFQQLCGQAQNQITQNTQNSARTVLINQLGALSLSSEELTSAMAAVEADDQRNAVLCRIIAELTADTLPTVTRKQQLINELRGELDTVIELDTQLAEINAKLLCPSILLFEKEYDKMQNDTFFEKLKSDVLGIRTELLADEMTDYDEYLKELLDKISAAYQLDRSLLDNFSSDSIIKFTQWESLTDAFLTEDTVSRLETLGESLALQKQLTDIRKCMLFKLLEDKDLVVAWGYNSQWLDDSGEYFKKTDGTIWQNSEDKWVKINLKRLADGTWKTAEDGNIVLIDESGAWVSDAEPIKVAEPIDSILKNLLVKLRELGNINIPKALRDTYSISLLEDQLLADIRALDKNRDFYYNVPVESAFAIDFTEGDQAKNTLMNPAVNYDINNINNNFVISKIDINYLTTGLQIARSSKNS